ncbi:MAG: hypothetical protein ACYDCL_00705 [Myxococcales bacterium]
MTDAVALLALGMLTTAPAAPPLVAVEVGALIEPVAGRFCKLTGDPAFQLTAAGALRLAASGTGARAELAFGDCTAPQIETLAGVGPFPRAPASAEVELDRGLAVLQGEELARRPIWWQAQDAAKFTATACPTVTLENGAQRCALPLPAAALHAALPQGPSGLVLLRLPAGTPLPGEPFVLWDRHGARRPLDAFRVPVRRFVLDEAPVRPAPLEAWRSEVELPVAWPGAIEAASCATACRISDDGERLIASPPSEGASLAVRLTLRDGVVIRGPQGFASALNLTLPLARCRLRPLAPALLGGVDDHRLPLELGANCPRTPQELTVETSPPTASAVLSQSADGRRLLVSLGHVPRSLPALDLRLLAGPARAVVGSVSVPITEGYLGTRAQLVDPQVGVLDAIPTNRKVRVELLVPDPSLATALTPEPLAGYYTVVGARPGVEIQGLAASGGTVPILVGYRPAEAGLAPDAPPLALFSAEPGYRVQPVSVPISLSPEDPRASRFLAVLCRESSGAERRIAPGQIVNLPFENRHSCRLRIDRSVLLPEEGPQRLRLTVAVTHPDGTPAPGGFSKVLLVAPRPGHESVWIEPTIPIHAFDHVHVALAHEPGPPYAESETIGGLTGQEVTLVFGNARLRLYGSATIPTGLYRLTSGPDGGVVAFSAGALIRLAPLDRDGKEFPVDLETGLFGTNLAQPTPGPSAILSLVAGIGLNVPILNANQPTQASVGLHAWFEYAPTVVPSIAQHYGQQFAFIFGPSVSIGDIGANF